MITPNIGPKNAEKVSKAVNILILLNKDNQNIATNKANKIITKPVFLIVKKFGKKFINVFCAGI